MKLSVLSFCGAFAAALAATLTAQAADEHPSISEAVATLVPQKASGSNVAGTLVLKQEKGYVLVTGEITGLAPGKHGFHIHAFGELGKPDGTSAGGHYNPSGHMHGGLDTKERHEGDLGNIDANDQGTAAVNVKATGVELHHIIGRSLVVHAKADDLKSQPAGDSGPRIAVGVIGLAEVPAK